MRRIRPLHLAVALLLIAIRIADAAEILQQVPRDALGLAVVRNLSEADAKAGRALSAVGSRFPGPLALLKSIAGIQAGLDERRDLMIVLLPPLNNSARFSLALWLPVEDYDALVHSLDGDPGRRVAAVTLAGEDLLVVRQDDWAVVMDPDQRDRLELLREIKPAPPGQVAEWTNWVNADDASVVVLPAGMKALWSLAESEKLFEPRTPLPPGAATDQDLFGPANRPRSAAGGWAALRGWIRSAVSERPELARWAANAESATAGVRLDQDGNSVFDVRLAFADDAVSTALAQEKPDTEVVAAPHFYPAGDFVLTGSGQVSPQWVVPAVAPYVRQVANDLATNYGSPVDDEDVARFRQGVEKAIADVRAFAVLTRPGSGDDAVFTNNFLAVRVTNAQKFRANVAKCVLIWNEMLANPRAAMRLIFKSKSINVAADEGTEYSIDMASAVDAPAIPEARASMEKLFGPGGLFRLQVVEIDESTVLLASATEAQVAQVIEGMKKKVEFGGNQLELRGTARLLSPNNGWFLCVSPSGYTSWLKRQIDAVLGEVIGGPVVPQFPTSPPIAFVGNVHGNVVWIEAAVPIQTLRGAGQFWRR
jgi:hypothetical protein